MQKEIFISESILRKIEDFGILGFNPVYYTDEIGIIFPEVPNEADETLRIYQNGHHIDINLRHYDFKGEIVKQEIKRMCYGTGWMNHEASVALGYCKRDSHSIETRETLIQFFLTCFTFCSNPKKLTLGSVAVEKLFNEGGFTEALLIEGPDGTSTVLELN